MARLRIEHESGKTEVCFLSAWVRREMDMQEELEGAAAADRMLWCAWYLWTERGWTSCETWQDFAREIDLELVKDEGQPDPLDQ